MAISKHEPRGKWSCLIGCAVLALGIGSDLAWAGDDEIEIDRANWSNDRNRLTVRGEKAPDNATVTIRYGKKEDNGTVIGTAQADDEGQWTFRINDPDPIPCDVTAQAGGDDDDKGVRYAPSNCSNDGGGGSIPNATPTANANSPYNGITGGAVNFSSAVSNDPDGSITSYLWVFGDGSSSNQANPSHTYTFAGTYTATLTVSDNEGASDIGTAMVTIADPQSGTGVSINSTAQNSGSKVSTAVTEQPQVGNDSYSVLAINDLGMHCGDLDTRIASILPPFQVLLAQVVQKGGKPILNPAGVELYYSAASNPNDPVLDLDPSSVLNGVMDDGRTFKTNYWDSVIVKGAYNAFYPFDINGLMIDDLGLPVPNLETLYFDVDGNVVPDGTGIIEAVQHAMPGIANPYSEDNTGNAPQAIQEYYTDKPFFVNFPFGYVAKEVNWHEAAGIPFAAFDDFGRENAYPLVRVEARDGTTTLSTVDTVLPISGEASCTNCHTTESDYNGAHGVAGVDSGHRTNVPTDMLTTAGLPVAISADDPDDNMPPKVSLEYAADLNILRLHDLKHGENYVKPAGDGVATDVDAACDISANGGDGNENCLTNKALKQGQPVVCQVCHYTPALDLAQVGPKTGPVGSEANGRNQLAHQSNSRVIHNHGGDLAGKLFTPIPAPVQDPLTGIITNQDARLTALEENCYQCHPGKDTQCLRGAMFNGGMLCSDCHGSLEQVGADFSQRVTPINPGDFMLTGLGNFYDPDALQPRVPWANEPGCGSCHTGDATDNLAGAPHTLVNTVDSKGKIDGIRLRQAFLTGDAKATPIVPTNKRFAEPVVPASFNGFDNPGAGNPQLYRVSTGHGGVMCEGCHGATHAEWPNAVPFANDNVAAKQLQGHVGTLIECDTCHTGGFDIDDFKSDVRETGEMGGPHGMHPIDAMWNDKHKEVSELNKNSCRTCHGPDGEGTVLSRMAQTRNLECKDEEPSGCGGDKRITLTKGTEVSCVLCHKENQL